MSLAALRAWAEPRGIPVEVEEVTRVDDRVHVRLWSMLDGDRLYMERVTPAAQLADAIDAMGAEWLTTLRDG